MLEMEFECCGSKRTPFKVVGRNIFLFVIDAA
jgi:hypothetical protein